MRFHIYVWLLKIFVFSCAYFSCIPNSCLGCYVWFWKTCVNNAICFETPYWCICRAFGTLWKSNLIFTQIFRRTMSKNKSCVTLFCFMATIRYYLFSIIDSTFANNVKYFCFLETTISWDQRFFILYFLQTFILGDLLWRLEVADLLRIMSPSFFVSLLTLNSTRVCLNDCISAWGWFGPKLTNTESYNYVKFELTLKKSDIDAR